MNLERDRWNGALARLPRNAFTLVAADTDPVLRLRYDPAGSEEGVVRARGYGDRAVMRACWRESPIGERTVMNVEQF